MGRDLYLHGREIDSPFQLLGDRENDITFSIGWVLKKSPKLLDNFLYQIYGKNIETNNVNLKLQEHGEKDKGYTDLEIETNNTYTIIEAKKGWILPTLDQLERYVERFSGTKKSKLVVLTECSVTYGKQNLPTNINGIPIMPYSWKKLWNLTKRVIKNSRGYEKELNIDLSMYLGGLMKMQNYDSNLVYVVSISDKTEENWDISWIDVVEKKKKYFHPIAPTWPKEPPNYLAFRYYGELQSIHHVDSYIVTDDLSEDIPEIQKKKKDFPYYVYRLGPGFKPSHTVKTGKNIVRARRVSVMLDTLFISKTISEAEQITKKRMEKFII